MALYRDPYAELADEYLNRGAPAAPATPARAAAPVEPTQEEIDASRRRSALRRTSESEKALNQGLAGIESSGYAVRGLARIGYGDEEGGLNDLRWMEETNQRAAAEGPRVQNLDQIEGVGDAFEYARNLGVGQVPNIALTAATGGVGGVARGVGSSLARTGAQSVLRTRLARELATEAGETVVSRATQREAARRAAQQFASKEAAPLFSQTGAKVGAAVGGSALQAGQTAGAVLDEESTDTVGVRAAKAATGAALTGSLEALPVMALFRRYGLTGATEAAEKAVTGNVLARVAKQGAKQGAAESATELAQTVGEVATHKWVNDNVDLLGDEALNQYVNAAVGGAVGGAIFGAPAGIRGNRDEAARTRIRDGLTQGWNSVSEKMRRTVTPAPVAAPVSEPVETTPTGDVASRVAAKVETLRQTFEQDVKPRLEAGASDIQKQFTELLERFKKDDEANSLLAEFEAEPFDFTDINGEAVFTGAPMASFANRDLLGDVKQAGLKGMSAQLAAALPTLDDALRLSSNGGLDAPVRAFRGEDVGKFSEQELDSLFSYMRALPEDKANKFRRFLATQEVLRERGFLQSEDAQVTTPAPAFTERAARVGDAAAARSMSEANNTVARVDRELQRAVRGAPISGQRGLDNRWWTQPDEKGVRREVNLATALKALDQDKDFQEETKTFSAHDRQVAKLARIVQAATDAGTPIDLQSIRSVPLNKSGSVVIPQSVVDSLKRGLGMQVQGPSGRLLAMERAARGEAFQPDTRPEVARAVNDNRGQADRMDMVEEVQDPNAGLGSDALRLVPIQSGSGSPSGTQDTQYALPRNPEAQIDREAQNTQYFTEKGDPLPMEREPRVNPRVRLDTLLERYAGRKPENKVEDRRALLAQALRRKDLPASQLRELRDAADAYAEDRYARVVERNNKALAAWQKNKNPQTKRELNKARAALNMARADMAARQKRAEAKKPVAPVTVPRGPGKRNLERRRKTVEGKKARVAAENKAGAARSARLTAIEKLRREAVAARRRREELAEVGMDSPLPVDGEMTDAQLRAQLRAIKDALPDDPSGDTMAFGEGLSLRENIRAWNEEMARSGDMTKADKAAHEAETRVMRIAREVENEAPNANVSAFPAQRARRSERQQRNDDRKELWDELIESAQRDVDAAQAKVERANRLNTGRVAELVKMAKSMPLELFESSDVFLNTKGPLRDAFWTVMDAAEELREAQDVLRSIKRDAEQATKADLPADGAAAVTPANNPLNRSRRQLYQEAQEWINKTGVSETRRMEELIRIEGELATLGQHMDTAIRNEVLARRRQRVTPAKTFNAVRDALMSETVTTAEDALRAVRELASPEQRRLIDTLLQMDGVKNTSFTLEFVEKFPPGTLNATYYSTKHASLDGRITLRFPMLEATSDTAADPLHTLLHEAIHAMTSYAEQTNPAVSAALSRLLNHARAQAKAQGVDPDGWYGLSETQEFIAEAFTNPEFKKLLESMPAANTDLFKNLWEQFKDFVAKLLGIKGEAATALDEAITIGLEAGRLKQVARVEAVRAMLRGESASNLPGNEGEPINYMLMLPPQARIKLAAAFAPPLLGKTDKASAWNRIRELAPADLKPLLDTSDRGIALAMNLGIAYALDGRLDLAKQHRTPVGQMWDAISKTLQIPSANVYAQQIIKDLKDKNVGNGYDPVKRTVSSKLARNITKFAERKVRPVADALLKNIDTRIREQGIPAMTEMATLLSQRTGEFRADKERSFRQRVQEQQAQWLEKLGTVITGISPQDQVVLIRALQSQKGLPPKHKDLQPVFDGLRKWLDEFHRYSTDAGVKMGQIENYFPVAMDADEVARRREQFFELHRAPNFEQPIRERFKKWVRAEIDTVRQRAGDKPTRAETVRIERLEGRLNQLDKVPIDVLIGQLYEMAIYGGREHYIAGVNFTDEAHKPAFSNAKPRTSDFIFTHGTPEQKAAFSKFQDNNLSRVLITYANRGVRRAEWERMGMTERLSSLKIQAKVEGATGKQMQMFDDYVNQIMGTYNDNWNPLIYRGMQAVDRVFDTKVAETDFQKFKQAQSAILTYNNVRLLPLALVSSLVDPLATVVRSGSPAGALSNFTDAVRAFRDKSNDDQLRQMAEDLGVIERQGIQEALAYMYGNVYDPNSRAAKINSMLFRFNGLEAMTRFTRLMALQSGHRFLIRHAKGEGDSARYLSELGLEPSDIKVAENGRFVELNEKTQAALRRFVEESVVRPHAGQRPSWHNDPNFALAAQYKGYLYAFYETVLKRVGVELANGNPAVLAPLVLYLPMTAMAEAARDVAQGDDEDKDFDHYAKLSLERSGLLGARHGVLADAEDNVKFGNGVLGNLAGPTGQQLGDAYDVLTGDGSAGNLAVEALPGQALYKNWGE